MRRRAAPESFRPQPGVKVLRLSERVGHQRLVGHVLDVAWI